MTKVVMKCYAVDVHLV